MSNINPFVVTDHEFAPGLTLIEASAGTGKTFSISYLILRMILEQGIKIDQILTVTFTNAAVDEMKSRVRELLVEARRAYAKSDSLDTSNLLEAYIQKRLADHKDTDVKRLSAALADFDSAAISTIHGFCQRTLAEYPLESGQAFGVELVSDLSELKKRVVFDFWRRCFQSTEYVSSIKRAEALGHLVRLYTPVGSAEKLYEWVSNTKPDDILKPSPPKNVNIETLDVERLMRSVLEVEAWCDRYADAIASWDINNALVSLLDEDSEGMNKSKFNRLKNKWTENYRKLLTKESFEALFNKGQVVDWSERYAAALNMPSAGVLDDLVWVEENLETVFRSACLEYYRTELWQRQLQQGVLEFDDLIFNLKKAVAEPGSPIRLKLSERYEAALIDEFQDTDADQWEIFNRCFGDKSLYLIGDPKQAIYGFRGGDVDTYLQARDATSEHRRFTLPCNYRSDKTLVDATNKLFSFVDHPFKESARIMFNPVEPQPNADHGKPAPVSIWRWPNGDLNAPAQERLVLRNVVADIQKRARDESFDSYKSYAVLVRSHSRAAKYQQALLDVGIPAVIVTKNSIFSTDEAQTVRRLIRAIIEPTRKDLIRECIAEPIFSTTAGQYLSVVNDESKFYDWMSQLTQAEKNWQKKGFMFAVNALLEGQQAYQRAAVSASPERRLSNLRQVVELLQSKVQQEQLNKTELLDYLEAQIQTADKQCDEAQLRLESDEEAVSIVTLHASKGLEYKVVYLPDLYKQNRPKPSSTKRVKVDGEWWVGSQQKAESKSADRIKQELASQRAEEDLRLVYVGVTRARKETILVGPQASEKGKSSLDYLLGADCEKLFSEPNISEWITLSYLVDEPNIPSDSDEQPAQQKTLSPPRTFERNVRWSGQRHSFSNMVGHEKGHESNFRGADDEPESQNTSTESSISDHLPKGAHIGNLLHDLFEYLDFNQLHEAVSAKDGRVDSQLLLSLATKHNVVELFAKGEKGAVNRDDLDKGKHRELSELLRKSLTTPLCSNGDNASFSLVDLDPSKVMKEMPFYFGLGEKAETDDLNRLIQGAQEIPFQQIKNRALRGCLNGFVDLIFEHDGRFYVADYKSNYLKSGYGEQQLEQAMTDSNYGLQGLLYTLALHRYLKYTLSGYSYEQHFGGVKYLFLRGMDGDSYSGVFSFRPSETLIEELDAMFGMGEGALADV